jgi:hypothetical protein
MADHRLEIVLAGRDATQRAFKTVTARVQGLTKSVFNLRNAGLAAAGAAGLGYFVKRTIEATAEIKRNAEMAGVGVEAFQELAYAAGQYQVTNEALTDGLKELSLRTDEYVQTGAGPAKEAFERLGYSQAELNRKLQDTPALLQEIIGRMQGLDRAAQIRIADEIFGGQGGEQFVAMIRAGAGAFSDLRTEAYELGIVIDRDLVEESARARDTLDSLEKILSAQMQSAVADLAPYIVDLAGDMRNWVKENREFITQDIPKHIKDIADELSEIKTLYSSLPDGVVGAAGAGLVGKILFGSKTGAVIAATVGMTSAAQALLEPLEKIRREAAKTDDIWGDQSTLFGSPEVGDSFWENLGYDPDKVDDFFTSVDKSAQKNQQNAKETAHQLDDVIVKAKALDEVAIKGPMFGKPDGQPKLDLDSGMLDEYRNLYEQTRTPLENLYSDLGRINNMWEVGAFGDDKDTYFRAIEMYGEKFSATFDTVKNEAGETFAYMTDAFSGWAVQYSSELNNMLWDAEFSFKRIAESFGRMITEMMIQKQMMRLSEGVSSWVGGLFASEHGNVFSAGRHVAKYARGGIVDKPTIFPMANGAGLMGEAGAEAIMPLTRINGDLGVKAQTGPQNVRVEIHNDSGQAMEVTEARTEFDAQGMIVNLWIDAYQRNKGGLRNAIGG